MTGPNLLLADFSATPYDDFPSERPFFTSQTNASYDTLPSNPTIADCISGEPEPPSQILYHLYSAAALIKTTSSLQQAEPSQFKCIPTLELLQNIDIQSGPCVPGDTLAAIQPKRQRSKWKRRVGAGPNRFGRTGTRRCELCRRWRRKACSH